MVDILNLRRFAFVPVVLLCAATAHAQNYVDIDVGVVYSDVSVSEPSPIDGDFTDASAGYHLGLGAYRNKIDSNWIYGVKIEFQDVGGSSMLSLRAIDVGYKMTPNFVLNGFIGAARFDLATPATGYRLGVGAQFWFSSKWALAAEAAFGDTLARDKLLPGEVPGNSPDIFYDVAQLNLYFKYKF